MTKPLELIIPPQLDPVTLRYIEGCKAGGYEPMFHTMPPGLFEMKAKRFTNAELAAETHHADMVLMTSYVTHPASTYTRQAREQYWVLRRFATLPHYGEAQP